MRSFISIIAVGLLRRLGGGMFALVISDDRGEARELILHLRASPPIAAVAEALNGYVVIAELIPHPDGVFEAVKILPIQKLRQGQEEGYDAFPYAEVGI